MHSITIDICSFAELDDDAKEVAREWYRNATSHDDWHDHIFEDAATVADMLGINLRNRRVPLMNGQHRLDPEIMFSGFYSQGDGACFEGSYAYRKGSAKDVRKYAPQDTRLHRIADDLQAVQSKHFYGLTAQIEHIGRYYHSGCMSIDVDCRHCEYLEPSDDVYDAIIEAMRDFADWIYAALEREYDWLMSDDQVDESIIANEYEFTTDGHIA